MRVLVALLLMILATAGMAEERPRHGLIENRTGLPLTLPLQVKTLPGRDYYLDLRTAETGQSAVLAYIHGGQFFRLLMPPGTYELHAATGSDWRGPEALFGPDTEFFDLPNPLTFRAGYATKNGHLIDLTKQGQLTAVPVRPLTLCQYPLSVMARQSATEDSIPVPKVDPAFDTGLPFYGPDPDRQGLEKLGIETDPFDLRPGPFDPKGLPETGTAPIDQERIRTRLCL
ncbi:hypothetical protein [Palleronia caenipelagi]|uniref:Uncharacterized protein n=1 Tax=Palleronia caenipelagi TaxID=2489174 RepID=A0A547Q2K6_9RHOB|nr:hypothetical protein [Palleronia caenipelagi]TRD20615.1 hypothetical protein FEV53_09970 [Palleronia caenipelagi]